MSSPFRCLIFLVLALGCTSLFAEDKLTRVVMAIAEPGYGTERTLPALAKKIWTVERGYEVTTIIGDPKKHDLVGFTTAMKNADVLVLSIRRQALPADQVAAIRDHLAAGKPLLAIRTSSHGLTALGKGPAGHVDWDDFGKTVLGGEYRKHEGGKLSATFALVKEAVKHPILDGVNLSFASEGGLYFSHPHAESTTLLVTGTLEGREPEPVAWTNLYGKSRVFYTSLGQEQEFAQPAFQRLMQNAMTWLCDSSGAKVN